jgi:hypothetical protein
MNVPHQAYKRGQQHEIAVNFILDRWPHLTILPDDVEALAELLLTTWKQACKAQNESTRAAATAAEKFHKTKTPRPVYTLGTRPPFSIETLPNEEK